MSTPPNHTDPTVKQRRTVAIDSRKFAASFGLHAVLIAVSFTLVLPFVWMVFTSLKSLGEVGVGSWLPSTTATLSTGKYSEKRYDEFLTFLRDDPSPSVAFLRGELGLNSDPDISALVEQINGLILGPAIYQPDPTTGVDDRFADIDISTDTQGWLDITKPHELNTDAAVRAASEEQRKGQSMANGWILHDALPEFIDPPHKFKFENYRAVFQKIPFARYFWNSIFIAACVTFLQAFTSSLAAFSFSRLQWKGRDQVFVLYLSTMMLPGLVMMIPNYQIMISLGLVDTMIGLILPAAFTAFGTFLLRQFMLGIPSSLDEAAEIDGASKWRVYWDVILPLTRPGLVTLTIFTFMGNYQSFFWPLVMLRTQHKYTLPIGLLAFDSSAGQQTNLLMAAVTMSVLPMIIVFVVMQKQLVAGIQLGAVKG